EARALPVGSAASIEGVLTTRLGVLESGRAGFVQDGTAGIGVYVDLAVVDGPPAGTIVVIAGVIDERYGQRTLRAAVPDVRALSVGQLPDALPTLTGATGEALEGSRVQVSGPVIDTPGPLSDGTGLTVEDG